MYFGSFLKLSSYFKIFFVICVFNCCSTSLPLVYLNDQVWCSLVKPTQRVVGKKSQNNTNNQKMIQKKEQEAYFTLQGPGPG